MRSDFEEFIETNLMVQSEFNLDFLFVSYNIFSLKIMGPAAAAFSTFLRLSRCPAIFRVCLVLTG
jgi:hypothetical protein